MIHGKKVIALCTYGINDSQVFSFITELNELLKANSCTLFIYAMNTEIGNGGSFYKAEDAVYSLIPYDITDAIIIMDEKIKSREVVQRIIDEASGYGVPTIVIDGDYEESSLVKYDYAKGFEAVVRHIIEYHKVKNPHFMAGKRKSEFSNERINVFKKVIEENGIPFDDSRLSYGDFWSVPSRAAAKELLKREVLPDAVICANDIMAINVCDVFANQGIKCPDDFLVSGFDGIDEAFLSTPGITTAICDSQALADAVMEVVQRTLDGERNIKKWIIPSFIASESCGCPRCDLNSLSRVHELNNRFYHHQDDIHVMQNLTAMMMCSKSIKECAYHMRNSLTESVFCVVEDACFQADNNYFLEDIERTTRSIIYNANSTNEDIVPYSQDTMIPKMNEVLDKGAPLIFNVLEYMGKTIGFVCYFFDKCDLVDYNRTPSITNCLSMGLGGFVTLQYQEHLRNQIQAMYQNDALTGLYNRVAFLNKFEELREDDDFIGKKLSMVMCDLNGLKVINDTRGHTAGDKAIAAVARAMKESCPEDALCVRFGGDEMLALIPGECDPNELISSIVKKLEIASKQLGYTVSASFGFHSMVVGSTADLDKIIALADEDMYRMKKRK